ncbi:hypothetical protein BESB_060090 [Besnoitia besnoiti]|uniref:LSM domain-containing protein n=1 Tax=Besnoitia besnoiti TaxID=94643 RepID=A0A2A9MIA4_BESBE|nr:hypothetical protein BESB_060090 [Besnoitia besnoiti]PFH35122.1 hypothetical protein BESB_060090 [Besnoitia besnoiti]
MNQVEIMANKRAALSLRTTPDFVSAGDTKKPRICTEPNVDFTSADFNPYAALQASDLSPPIAEAAAVTNLKVAEMLLPWGMQEQAASSASSQLARGDDNSLQGHSGFEGSLNAARNKQFRKDMVAAVAASKVEASKIGDIIEHRFADALLHCAFCSWSASEKINRECILGALPGWCSSGTEVKVHVICHDLLPGVGEKGTRAMLAGTVRWFDDKLNILLQPARLMAVEKADGSLDDITDRSQLGWVYIRCRQVAAISALTE